MDRPRAVGAVDSAWGDLGRPQGGDVQITVDTHALVGLAGAVRQAAAAVDGFADPPRPDVTAVGAADAVRVLLRVAREQREDVAACLRGVAVLVETAAIDYAHAEAQAVR